MPSSAVRPRPLWARRRMRSTASGAALTGRSGSRSWPGHHRPADEELAATDCQERGDRPDSDGDGQVVNTVVQVVMVRVTNRVDDEGQSSEPERRKGWSQPDRPPARERPAADN